ncbi:hypothetical protein ElyMa_002191300 [Elysia marginata]|uniref:Uncharacterized protein n=1 Tax=Elysia marginata TaxID=1093978 RepID=A0AAV4FRT5_9GAST|nr:hypothetical protein ElyMa_002191300 [Elysia marginata]
MPGLKRYPAPPPPRLSSPDWRPRPSASPHRYAKISSSPHRYAKISSSPHRYAKISSSGGARKRSRPKRIPSPPPPPPTRVSSSRYVGLTSRPRRSSEVSDVILYPYRPYSERGRPRTRGTPRRDDVLVWRPSRRMRSRRTSSLPGSRSRGGEPWWFSKVGLGGERSTRSRSLSRTNMPLIAMAAARRRRALKSKIGGSITRDSGLQRYNQYAPSCTFVHGCASNLIAPWFEVLSVYRIRDSYADKSDIGGV